MPMTITCTSVKILPDMKKDLGESLESWVLETSKKWRECRVGQSCTLDFLSLSQPIRICMQISRFLNPAHLCH